jgi:hypothetical protein
LGAALRVGTGGAAGKNQRIQSVAPALDARLDQGTREYIEERLLVKEFRADPTGSTLFRPVAPLTTGATFAGFRRTPRTRGLWTGGGRLLQVPEDAWFFEG